MQNYTADRVNAESESWNVWHSIPENKRAALKEGVFHELLHLALSVEDWLPSSIYEINADQTKVVVSFPVLVTRYSSILAKQLSAEDKAKAVKAMERLLETKKTLGPGVL